MKNRKKNTKLILLALLICITLGYAALRTGLNINGTTNVSSASWNVYFSNYQMSNATNITPTTEPEIVGTTTTSISYEVDLDVPGDLYEFSVEVVNGGSLDALISLVSKYNGSEIGPSNPVPAYIEYVVSDVNGNPIVDGHRLNHGNREIVKVFVKYKEDASVLPSQDATLRFDVEIEATQAAKETSTETYTVNDEYNDGKVFLNQAIPSGITTYPTPEAARLAFNNRPTYLKHVLNGNNIVTESYPALVINEETKQGLIDEVCGGDPICGKHFTKLVNGTYYLRGGVDEHELQNQPIYEANKNIIKTAFNYLEQPEYCSEEDELFICNISGHLVAQAEKIGNVYARYNYVGCMFGFENESTFSYCEV